MEGDFYNEAFDADGNPRADYEPVLAAVAERGPQELTRRVNEAVAKSGACFGPGSDDTFHVDPVPRLVPAAEWRWLRSALAQRSRALNAFIDDVYSERRIVSAGVVAAHLIEGADHYEPAMAGVRHPAGPAPLIGFDLVRGSDGRLRVLEDNLRTPSGLAYAVLVRKAVDGALAGTSLPPRVDPDACFAALTGVLTQAAGDTPSPRIALLTDGPSNPAWWEHRVIARRLGIAIAMPEKLRLEGGRLCVQLPSGKAVPLDVVYRRTNEDRLRDENGRATWLGEVLLEPLRRGTVAVVNAPGSGVADDKLVHAYVEDMVRFYLGEQPLIESVRTYDLTRPELLTRALGRMSGMVTKPRAGSGGDGVFIGAAASVDERAKVAEAVRAAPHRYAAQETVRLSRHPTVVDGGLEPRHVDLRAFAVGGELVPAPLTRVALRSGSMIVNSSQGGGVKDTWIIDR